MKQTTRPFSNYSDAPLGPQYRDFRDVPSLCAVLLEHFKTLTAAPDASKDLAQRQGTPTDTTP